MKKITGSVRVEIKDESKESYEVDIIESGGLQITVSVPKSAVTDIHEEVDWSKVKKGTPVAMWGSGYDIYTQSSFGFLLMVGSSKFGIIYNLENIKELEPSDWFDNCMLLTDWLKEYGNKEDGDE